MERTILHCDLNAFYASVEEVLAPELRNVPMAVCGNPENRHGIILAKNQLAKGFDVKTAETIGQAKRKCPELRLVLPHHDEYAKYSKLVNDIYKRFTDLVEPFGIDESWLDITGSMHLFGTPSQVADMLRETVKRETSLTISVGVSFNKVFSKLGSDYKKSDATTVISRENFKEIVYPLPVSDLLFVGRNTAEVLKKLGIDTIGVLAASDRNALSAKLGKIGETIHDYANGIDNSPVKSAFEKSKPKSVGRGITFRHDLTDISDIHTGISVLSDDVASRLRRHGLKCRAVSLTVRDSSFKTISRQRTLMRATFLESEISDACRALYRDAFTQKRPVRMLTVTASSLVPSDICDEQLSLFSDTSDRKRRESMELTIDRIREKYGKSAISKGSTIKNSIDFIRSDDD